MTQPETWALADSQFTSLPWSPTYAAKAFKTGSLPRLIEAHELALAPVDSDWLQKRLRLLWKSSVVNGSLDATAWLHETGRLLADIPQDILSEAIDRSVKESERGFMPTVGQIRFIAEPEFRKRELHARRLAAIRDAADVVQAPAAPKPSPEPEDGESTAEMLKRIWPTMNQHQPGHDGSKGLNLNPERECRKPNRENYMRLFGVDPDASPAEEAA